MIGAWREKSLHPVWSPTAVMGAVLSEYGPQVPLTEDRGYPCQDCRQPYCPQCGNCRCQRIVQRRAGSVRRGCSASRGARREVPERRHRPCRRRVPPARPFSQGVRVPRVTAGGYSYRPRPRVRAAPNRRCVEREASPGDVPPLCPSHRLDLLVGRVPVRHFCGGAGRATRSDANASSAFARRWSSSSSPRLSRRWARTQVAGRSPASARATSSS